MLHQHTDECYDDAGQLICPWQEEKGTVHTHDESCYVQEDGTVSEKPVCGLQEVQEHVHTEECFEQQDRVLSCGMEEHVHTESCLEKEETASEQETVFEKETDVQQTAETAAEKETAAEAEKESEKAGVSQTKKIARAGETADMLMLLDTQVTAVRMYYQGTDNQWIEITSETTNVPGNAHIKKDISYAGVDIDALLEKNGVLCYTLPEILKNPTASGYISDSEGTSIGMIALDENQKVKISF